MLKGYVFDIDLKMVLNDLRLQFKINLMKIEIC